MAAKSLARQHRSDYLLVTSIVILLVLGLVIIYSISPVLSHKIIEDSSRNYFLYGQLLHLGVGLVVFAVTSRIRYQRWQKLLPALIVLSAFTLLLLLIPGVGLTKNGATRWVGIGGLSFQPAELIKFTLAIYLATRWARLRDSALADRVQTLWPTLGLLGVLTLLIVFLQRDMGTMLVMTAMIVGVFFVSGVPLRQLKTLLLTGLGIGTLSILLFPHRIARVLTFFNPDQNVSGSSYHLNQALIAIGSGGLFGLGLGKSIQVYGYLPEAANDSIFAIIAETFGFVGSLIVLFAFALFMYRGWLIAAGAPDRFGSLLAVAILAWIGSQTIINMAAMLGLVPLTGIPLPFLSYGGTSLIFVMAAAGVLVNISKYSHKRGAHADSSVRGRNGRSRYTARSRRPAPAQT